MSTKTTRSTHSDRPAPPAKPIRGKAPGQTSGRDDIGPSNTRKDPEQWKTGDEPMTGAQRSYLETLSEEAGQPVDANLTKADASEQIDALREQDGTIDARQSDDPNASNTRKDPEHWKTGDEPMTGAQRSYLQTLSQEAGEPFDDTLTKAQASERIDALRQKSPRVQASG